MVRRRLPRTLPGRRLLLVRPIYVAAVAVLGWLAFALVYADAISADFDIRPSILNGLAILVGAGGVALLLIALKR